MEPTQEQKKKEEKTKKRWLPWLIAVTIALLIGALGYLWWLFVVCQGNEQTLKTDKQDLQSKVDTLTKQLEELKKEKAASDAKTEDEKVSCSYTPSQSFKDNIRDAITSKNTAAFATYTTNPVYVLFAASEKAGNETPDEAALSLEYTHSAIAPWDFALDQAVIDGYKAGFYASHFPDGAYVGRSSDGMVVSFGFTCDGSKIDNIFVAAPGAL